MTKVAHNRLSHRITASPKQIRAVARMFPGETVHISQVLAKPLEGAIFVEPTDPKNSVLISRDIDENGKGCMGITREGFLSLKEHHDD